MSRAIALAVSNPSAPFAALLVDLETTTVLVEGINRHQENPTWHGEMDAINRCAGLGQHVNWAGLRLYTTAEPCCMCQGAILWAGIPEVVFGTSIRTLTQWGWRQINIGADEVARRSSFSPCRLMGGVLEAECDALFRRALSEKRDDFHE